MVTAKMVTRARAEGLVILLLALGYVWESRKIPSLFQSPGVPGPAAFPAVLGLVLGLAGLWRLVRGAPLEEATARAAKEAVPVAEPVETPPTWLQAHGRFYALWAVVLGFMFSMPELGFPLGAGVAMLLMFWLLGEERWHVSASLSIATTAILYLAFSKGLGVRLPTGLLQGLLGK